MPTLSKPVIAIARAIFPQVVARLQQHFDVVANQDDRPMSPAELAVFARGATGLLCTASERVDAALLAACPDLKICANMAVGYNNFDLDAMTRCGVLATNTPDVLTETTADFGFALLMAAARRVTESEHFLRAGHWHRWSYDMFAGQEIHGSTLGIIGMGRIGQGIARRGALGFGMRVIYHNRSRLDPVTEAACHATYVSKTELLQAADHVMLVLPYSATQCGPDTAYRQCQCAHPVGDGRSGGRQSGRLPDPWARPNGPQCAGFGSPQMSEQLLTLVLPRQPIAAVVDMAMWAS